MTEQTTVTLVPALKKEIAHQYLTAPCNHIQQLKAGQADNAPGIKDFARMLYVHPVHRSNCIKEVTGRSTCNLYEERLLRIAKELLVETNIYVSGIAIQLTYGPSSVTRFFNEYTDTTPKKIRDQHA